ncbi:MAG: tetratricopeptide repeat protein [Rhodanobacteraceae bacterium]
MGMRVAVCLLLALLGGCATTGPAAHGQRQLFHAAVQPPSPKDDVMLHLLAAQFALQRNDLESGARGFAEAAQLSADPQVAEEATHLALAVKDWSLARSALDRWQTLAPAADGVQQARAWIALGSGNADAAFTDLVTMAARDNPSGWRQIAQLLLAADDKSVATAMLDRLATPERLGEEETTWIAVSQLAFKLGDNALASRLSTAAVNRFHSADAYAWAARLALHEGDRARARKLYAQALQSAPDDRQLRAGYAALLAEMGDNAGAARVLAVGPQDDATYAARAAYMARADDKPALNILYRELEADASPRSDVRLYLLGQVAELLERHAEALGWYRRVSQDSDNWFDAQTRICVVLDRQGKTASALDALHRLRAEVGDDNEQRRDTWLVEADLLTRHQRRAEALAAYSEGLDALPDDLRLLYARAMIEVDMDELAAAERDLRRVIELKPDDAEALNALGYTLADRTGRKQEALGLIRKAIKLKPDEPAIIDSMGWVEYRLGNTAAALKDLRRAFALQPDPEIAAHLGEVLWIDGKHAEALRVWEQGRKKNADNKALIETMQRLTR